MENESAHDILPDPGCIDHYVKKPYTSTSYASNVEHKSQRIEFQLSLTLNGNYKNVERMKELILGTNWSIDEIDNRYWGDKTTFNGKLETNTQTESKYDLSIKLKNSDYTKKTIIKLQIDCAAEEESNADILIGLMKKYITKNE
jgi:hypothetical protein